jgi:hypothetical protein
MSATPRWLDVHSCPDVDPALCALDSGEREAIALALATNADTVLLDERKARQVARGRQLRVAGTLGVILLAANTGGDVGSSARWVTGDELPRVTRAGEQDPRQRASPRLI